MNDETVLAQLTSMRDTIESLEHEGAKIRADLKFQRNRYERLYNANKALADEAGFSSMSKKKKDDDDASE